MRRRLMMNVNDIPFENQYLTFEALESGTFSFTNTVEYKIGNKAWHTLSSGESTPIVPQGEKIKWRGNLTNPGVNVGIGTFSSTGRYNAEGNPLSLVLYNKFVGVIVMPDKYYLFCRLFYQNTNLISTKNLKLVCTTLRTYCYKETFRGCTALIQSCDLPAEVAKGRSYDAMYYGCTSLIKAPYIGLLYVAEGVCYQMFYGCSNLKSIERIPDGGNARYTHSYMFYNCSSLEYIPQVTLALRHSCNVEMFYGCTSLIDASNITFKQFAGQEDQSCCLSMFNRCTSLVTSPKEVRLDNPINITQFRYMFLECTSLTESPDLYIPNITTSLMCAQMFDGCSSLQRIKCLATIMTGSNCLQNWVRGISPTGTFIKHPDTIWATGNNGIPSGWTVEDADV